MWTLRIEMAIIVIFFSLGVDTSQHLKEFPFQNTSLPFDVRVNDLVKRLTVEEMVLQMSKGGAAGSNGGPTPGIPRLGIDKYEWATECIHGDAVSNATSFPQSIGMAAAFNPELIHEVAEAISTEVRAKNNAFRKKGFYGSHSGLSCFSPVINIMRHPLWGRNQETYGEDPVLSGIYASNFASGLRGSSSQRFYRANAVCKHFDAYGGPEDLPESRLSFDAKVIEQDLRLTYLPQFKDCIEGGALGVMCSYNSVNGIPACANKKLLTDILRMEWGFKGFVVSDAGAVEFVYIWHRYKTEITTLAETVVNAGLNLELPAYKRQALDNLLQAINSGGVTNDTLRDRVRPLFYTRMRLGEFDPPDTNPYTQLNLSVIQSPEHQALSVKAATQSFVLLKNTGLLPIKDRLKSIAIVGPFSNNSDQQLGNYAPVVDPHFVTTPLTGLSPLADQVSMATGCDDTICLHYNRTDVISHVTNADLTVLCLGTGSAIETENFDRPNMDLPQGQQEMLMDIINHAGGPVVLLVFSGGPVDLRIADDSEKIEAIIHCFFPAQATGTAVFNVITMRSATDNPAGRLPFTWYSSQAQVPSMTDYGMKNRTYRYFTGVPLYPFGYGLSYTQFYYSKLTVIPERVKAGDNVTATFSVMNNGTVDGDEVNQMYISWLNSSVPVPIYQLVNVKRIHLSKDETKVVSLNISSDQMAVWIDGKGFVVEPGQITVYVGGQLPNQKRKVFSNVLKVIFTIFG